MPFESINDIHGLPITAGKPEVVRFDAAAIADSTGFLSSAGLNGQAGGASIVIEIVPGEHGTHQWAGKPRILGAGPRTGHESGGLDARVIDLGRAVILPGLVNAHAHLDLTHIGPQPHPEGGFVPWVDMVRGKRRHLDEEIAESVQQGVDLSLRAGVVAIGDIAGAPAGRPSLAPFRVLSRSPLLGVSFLEFFGIGGRTTPGRRPEERLDQVRQLAGDELGRGYDFRNFRLGLQPHAPNTVDLDLYELTIGLSRTGSIPACTHLAESPEEREFVGVGRGPQRVLLERLGVWDDGILERIGRGQSPVGHLRSVLAQSSLRAVHLNDVSDSDLDILAASDVRVAYCPQASRYFGAAMHFGPHRYRDMLARGLSVALGTDSIINQPSGALSILDEARILWREGAATGPLFRMLMDYGADFLGLPRALFRILPAAGQGRSIAGLIAVPLSQAWSPGEDPREDVLRGREQPLLLAV